MPMTQRRSALPEVEMGPFGGRRPLEGTTWPCESEDAFCNGLLVLIQQTKTVRHAKHDSPTVRSGLLFGIFEN